MMYQPTERRFSSRANWTRMPWRRWMLVMLRQLGLDKYIANENVPGVAKERQQIVAQRKWSERDARPEMYPN